MMQRKGNSSQFSEWMEARKGGEPRTRLTCSTSPRELSSFSDQPKNVKLSQSLNSDHVAPRESPTIPSSSNSVNLLLSLSLLSSGNEELPNVELGFSDESRKRQVVKTQQPQRRLRQDSSSSRFLLRRRSRSSLRRCHREPNDRLHIWNSLPHLPLDLYASHSPKTVISLLEGSLNVEEGGEDLVKFGETSGEGDGCGLLDEGMFGEEAFGGELFGED